eukprot:409871-Pleurochrysis_carterae.AAC.1
MTRHAQERVDALRRGESPSNKRKRRIQAVRPSCLKHRVLGDISAYRNPTPLPQCILFLYLRNPARCSGRRFITRRTVSYRPKAHNRFARVLPKHAGKPVCAHAHPRTHARAQPHARLRVRRLA